ncbi:hypothetical protein SAMN05444266_112149 [Chitinophaga jiangningensis]|uniref:SnoaL-like domain-containing protein n=1 Tax=Chitinophaga jiangningensis TaxID=1419482 RepID=A0A1M7MB35_9BACT|nr:nuclear transport factor 2 family protein [Chitinophaga jiangningensis]SHM87521.1 hypothetical protein SAMN05444266_112149 [Chitinophaga jiangningensis]
MNTKEQISALGQQAFKNHLAYLSSGRIEEWVDLFTENGILEFPYGPKDFPTRVSGKPELHEYMKNFPLHFKVEFENLYFHPTADPHTTIAEFTSKGHALATGNPYNQRYISVVTTTDDGKIAKYVDFWNPMVALEAIEAPLTAFVKE